MNLTPRQLQVVRLLVQGKSHREVAQRLGIAHQTVAVHLREIKDNLGFATMFQLAFRLGLEARKALEKEG
jgi:DNA-binding NarL/FixJ family response regulator